MKKLLFIYNPHAGKGQIRAKLADVLDIFTKAGWLVTVRPTQGKSDATYTAAQLGGGFDRLVCCGGDGTLHEVVTGLMESSRRPELGYIPAGTTNDYSRNLKLPKGYEAMAAVAAEGVPRPVDIGRFNERYFVYVAAFGAFTDVAYDTPQQVKNMFGHLAYVLEGISRLGSLKGYQARVEYDGGVLEEEFIFGMVSNTVSVGGMLGLPASSVALDDGLLEVVLVRTPRNPMELQGVIAALMKQTTDEAAGVRGFHTSRLKITCAEETPWTLDGEFGGDHDVVEIHNLQKQLQIMVPAKYISELSEDGKAVEEKGEEP